MEAVWDLDSDPELETAEVTVSAFQTDWSPVKPHLLNVAEPPVVESKAVFNAVSVGVSVWVWAVLAVSSLVSRVPVAVPVAVPVSAVAVFAVLAVSVLAV